MTVIFYMNLVTYKSGFLSDYRVMFRVRYKDNI